MRACLFAAGASVGHLHARVVKPAFTRSLCSLLTLSLLEDCCTHSKFGKFISFSGTPLRRAALSYARAAASAVS